jgi:DNA-binding transcriptional ArsR family regulator
MLADTDLIGLEANAEAASELLKLMANQHRLLILCHLVARGEASVNTLAEVLGLSQSALSQHLAKLREDGLVAYRREAQTLFYHVADQRAVDVLKTLKRIYCP